MPVFGLIKRSGKVAAVIKDTSAGSIMPIMKQKIIPDSIVYSDCWKAYDILDISGFKHFRINHSNFLVDKKNHINDIENFRNQAKRHMRKFNGVPKRHFGLFLKECQWRFNNPNPKYQLIQILTWLKPFYSLLSGIAPYSQKIAMGLNRIRALTEHFSLFFLEGAKNGF